MYVIEWVRYDWDVGYHEVVLFRRNIMACSPYMIPRKPDEYVYPGKVTFTRFVISKYVPYFLKWFSSLELFPHCTKDFSTYNSKPCSKNPIYSPIFPTS